MAKKKSVLTEQNARDLLSSYRINAIALQEMQNRKAAEQKILDDTFQPAFDQLEKTQKELFNALELWAESNPSIFANRKSVEWPDGLLGFRLGQPQLVKARTVSWETVLEKVSDVLGDQFIRVTSEIDKRSIIDQRDILKPEELDACHIAVVQGERFFIEPKTAE